MKTNLLFLIISLTFSTHILAQTPNYVPKNEIVGYWPFNGNAQDESGNGNNGIVNGATLTSDRFGNSNQAFSFLNNSIKFSNSNFAAFGKNSFSCSIWVKYVNSSNNIGNFVRYGNAINSCGWGIRCLGNGEMNLLEHNLTNNNINSIKNYNDNKWHHVVFVRDINCLCNKLYIDGELVNSKPFETKGINDLIQAAPLNIGTANGYENFFGSIDDFGLWKRALTDLEILGLFESSVKSNVTPKASPQVITNASVQNSVKIGRLVWTTQNLNVSTFRNGEKIPEANSKEEWLNAVKTKKPAYCYKDFDSKNGANYGKLYNYFAVEDQRGLAPTGWAIPSEDDVYDLQNSTNSNAGSGSKFKSKSGWIDYTLKETCPLCKGKTLYCSKCQGSGEIRVTYSGNGTNQTGFSAVPGCSVDDWFGATFDAGSTVFWISTSKNTSETKAGCLKISFDDAFLIYNGGYLSDKENKGKGFSVRCVKETKEYLDYYSEKQRLADEEKRKKENSPASQIAHQKAKVYADYYTKDWKDLKNKNVELYIRIQEIIINEWYRLDSLNLALKNVNDCDEKNTLTCYPEYYTDVSELLITLIKQKEIEKASDVLDKFLNYNFPSNNGDGLNMTSFKLLCEKSNQPASNNYGSQGYNKIIGIHSEIKFWILSIAMIEQSKLTMKIMQEFIVPYRPNRDKDFSLVKSIIDELEERHGYTIVDAHYLKFTSKALTSIWDFKISPNADNKSWHQTYSLYFNKHLEDELYDKKKVVTELIFKIDDNLYKSQINVTNQFTSQDNDFNIYYYLDKTGAAFLVNKSDANISKEDEAKLIIKAKKIRDKDLLEIKK